LSNKLNEYTFWLKRLISGINCSLLIHTPLSVINTKLFIKGFLGRRLGVSPTPTLQENISQIPGTSQVGTQVLWALPDHQAYWFNSLQIGHYLYLQNPSSVPRFLSEESGGIELQGPSHPSIIR
jgi:hypothetical protein